MSIVVILAIIWLCSAAICFTFRKLNNAKGKFDAKALIAVVLLCPLFAIILLVQWITESARRYYYLHTKRGQKSKEALRYILREHMNGMLREAKKNPQPVVEEKKEEPPLVVYDEEDSESYFHDRTEGEERSLIEEAETYFHFLQNAIVPQEQPKDKGVVFELLKSIVLPFHLHLGLHVAQRKGSGDESRFYIYDKEGRESRNLLKYLLVKPTELGAWDVYLLLASTHVMPCFWHGGYNQRKFIFTEAALRRVAEKINGSEMGANVDLSSFEWNESFTPHVKLEDDGAHVYCCYWNDWKGLVQEHIRFVITGHKVETCETAGEKILFQYDCGIMY